MSQNLAAKAAQAWGQVLCLGGLDLDPHQEAGANGHDTAAEESGRFG